MGKRNRNRRGQIVEPTHGKRMEAKHKQAVSRPIDVVTDNINVEVAINTEVLELRVGIFLDGEGHALPAADADELAQMCIAWLADGCRHPRMDVQFPLENVAYRVDREGVCKLAGLLGQHATFVSVLSALVAYEMHTKGLTRLEALQSVGAFHVFAYTANCAEPTGQLAA